MRKVIDSVTVVIPYYNGKETIEKAIQSVLSQSVKPEEILVVDDGSKPEHAEFIRQLANQLKFRLLTKPNGGQSSARNLGFNESTSKFICLLDQDDFFLPTHVEKLFQAANKSTGGRLGYVYSDVARGDLEGNVLFESTISEYGAKHPLKNLSEMLRRDMMILPSSTLIDRDAFLDVGGFDENLIGYEDDDLFIRFARGGYTSVFVPESLTMWTLNPDSTSFTPHMSNSRWKFYFKLRAEFNDDLENHNFYFRDAIAPRFLLSFMGDYLHAIGKRTDDLPLKRQRLIDFSRSITTSGHRYRYAHVVIPLILASIPVLIIRPLYSLYTDINSKKHVRKALSRIISYQDAGNS